MSATNTIAAYFLPAKRRTLVAPGFREPEIRGSGREKTWLTITAEQTEPNT